MAQQYKMQARFDKDIAAYQIRIVDREDDFPRMPWLDTILRFPEDVERFSATWPTVAQVDFVSRGPEPEINLSLRHPWE